METETIARVRAMIADHEFKLGEARAEAAGNMRIALAILAVALALMVALVFKNAESERLAALADKRRDIADRLISAALEWERPIQTDAAEFRRAIHDLAFDAKLELDSTAASDEFPPRRIVARMPDGLGPTGLRLSPAGTGVIVETTPMDDERPSKPWARVFNFTVTLEDGTFLGSIRAEAGRPK